MDNDPVRAFGQDEGGHARDQADSAVRPQYFIEALRHIRADILQLTAESAAEILEEDPDLSRPENAGLRSYMDRYIREGMTRVNL